MESESAMRDTTVEQDGKAEVNQTVLLSSKPLHRFIQREPKSLGIVLVVVGCAEFLNGCYLTDESYSSGRLYIPFWQGVLFTVCGALSIYSEVYPTKKGVTVSLAMYVVSILGVVVSVGVRISCMTMLRWMGYWGRGGEGDELSLYNRRDQLSGVEGLMMTFSLCVAGILIFLCVIARLALKSTQSQVIVHHVRAPRPETTTN